MIIIIIHYIVVRSNGSFENSRKVLNYERERKKDHFKETIDFLHRNLPSTMPDSRTFHGSTICKPKINYNSWMCIFFCVENFLPYDFCQFDCCCSCCCRLEFTLHIFRYLCAFKAVVKVFCFICPQHGQLLLLTIPRTKYFANKMASIKLNLR